MKKINQSIWEKQWSSLSSLQYFYSDFTYFTNSSTKTSSISSSLYNSASLLSFQHQACFSLMWTSPNQWEKSLDTLTHGNFWRNISILQSLISQLPVSLLQLLAVYLLSCSTSLNIGSWTMFLVFFSQSLLLNRSISALSRLDLFFFGHCSFMIFSGFMELMSWLLLLKISIFQSNLFSHTLMKLEKKSSVCLVWVILLFQESLLLFASNLMLTKLFQNLN